MSAISISSPFPTFTDVDGDPLESGYIYVGQANVDPVTFPIAVYWDAALTIPAAQPIRTIGGYPARNGSPARIYANSDYSIRVTNKNGSLVYSAPAATERMDSALVGYETGTVQDVLDAVTGPYGAASVGYTPAGTGAVATTVDDVLQEILIVNGFSGADPTGTTDSTTAINNAAAQAISSNKKLVAQGVFRISGSLDLRRARVDFSSATLVLDAGSGPIVIGGRSSIPFSPRQQFLRVYRSGGATATPTLRVAGSKGVTIDVVACDYMQLYADTAAPNSIINGSIAYCTLNLGKIDKLEVTNNPANAGGPVNANDGGTIQWINENRFNLQRCVEFVMSGTYEHNHNVFVGGTFEGDSTITLTNGWDNYFYDMRFEGSPTITLGATTQRNIIVNSYDTSSANFDSVAATVIDNGFDNVVLDDFAIYRNEQNVAYTDISDVVLDTQVTPSPRSRDLQRIYSATAFGSLAESGFIPVKAGDLFRFVTVGQTGSVNDANAKYRPRIKFYDAKLVPVNATTSFITTTGSSMTVVAGNTIAAGNNINFGTAFVMPAALAADVVFVKCEWLNGSPVGTSSAVAMYVCHFSKKTNAYSGIPRTLNQSAGLGKLVSGIPTQGYAPAGFTAIKSDATAKYVNRFAFETTTTAANIAGATVIAITAGTGTANGDIVGINQDDSTTHWTTIASGGGTTSITLTAGLPSASAAGSRVVFNRWSTY